MAADCASRGSSEEKTSATMSWIICSSIFGTSWPRTSRKNSVRNLGGDSAAERSQVAGKFGLAHVQLFDGKTGLPGLIDAHQSERPAGKSGVLHEVDHVLHALFRIFHVPEVMHDGRDSGKESEDSQGAELWLHAEQNTCAANDEGHAR